MEVGSWRELDVELEEGVSLLVLDWLVLLQDSEIGLLEPLLVEGFGIRQMGSFLLVCINQSG